MSSFPISISWQISNPPTGAFDSLANSAASLDKAMLGTAANFEKFGSSISQMESPLSGVSGSMSQLEGSMGSLEGSLSGAAGSMGEFAGSTEQVNGAISETGGFITDASGSMGELSSATGETGGAMTELSGTTTEFNGSIQETGGFVTEASTGMGELSTATTDTGTAMTDAGTAVTDMGTATTETNTALTESVDALGNVVPGLQDTATGAADSAQGFSDLAPPIEDSNAALDTSSGLLEGVSPLLGSTGENAATAATSTDDFSGAMSGLGTELGPVNGGLTTGNTLVGDFGTEAATTSTKTGDLKDSMATLAFGITTVVGAGYGLVNAFLGIRDAGFKVEAANIRAEKSASTLDKAVLGVSKSITKLATDSEAPIQGMGRLQTAFANFQRLLDAGVRSGPQFTAALNNLKAAGDGLHGTTVKDQQAIAGLNIQLDGLSQKAARADLDQRKLTKAMEGQAKAMLDAGMSIATLVGGMGSMVQTITSGAAAATLLKGAFIDLGIVMSQTIIPALAAIAAPVGIAVAAIVALIAAVTAIRANIKVFDELGASIGKTFPQLKPMLDSARQAFINFSDAINSSVSLMLGAFDSLTGGTLKLQEKWNGFTDTLPKGTANVNTLSQAITGIQMSFVGASDKAKLAKGQFDIVGDSVVRLSDGAKIGAGSWIQLGDGTIEYVKSAAKVPPVVDQTTTAMDAMGASVGATGVVIKEQSSGYSEMTNAQKLLVAATNSVIENVSKEEETRYKAIVAAQAYLRTIEGINPALFASGAAIVGVANALSQETQKHFETVSAAAQYIVEHKGVAAVAGLTEAQILALAEKLKEEEKASGKATQEISKHAQELDKLKTALAETNAELAFYADSTNVANRMQLEFNTGVADAKMKILDETFALAKMAGELSVWSDEQQRAQAIGNAFVKGLLEQVKATQKVTTDTAAAKGAVMGLRLELGNAESVMKRFNLGMEQGRKSALEFLAGLAEAKGEAVGFREELVKAATAITGAMVNMGQKSTEELQQLIEVAAGVPGAFEEIANELESMADEIISTLADAAREGSKEFMTEIEKMEDQLGQKFSEPMIQELELQANIKNAENDIKLALGTFASMLQNRPLEVALKTQAAQDAMRMLMTTVDQAAAMSPKFKPLQTALQNLAAWKPADGLAKLPLLLTNVVQEASKMEGGMQGAITAFDGMFNAAASTTAGLESLKTMFQGVGLTFNEQTGVITDSTGQIIGDLTTMSEKAGGAVTTTTTAMDTLGPAGTRARTTLAFEMVALTFIMDTWAQETKQSAIEVSTAFANMSTNTHNSMNQMASGFIIVITAISRMASDSQRMATTVSGSFSNMASNTRASMSTMASGFIIILTAFTRAGSEAQRMNTTVSSAMRSMGSAVASFASGMQSSMSRASSAMATATSRANALRSAINALKSKTITITTVYVTIRRTIFAAQGGAFVTSSPTNVGPMNVSEFGQKELVTVTPLQTPGRGTVKGLSNLIQGETAKKARQMLGQEGERKEPAGKKEVVMMRETPIVIQVDGREIARVVNKRIFEESDALV
jgi:methyl-accepting chemotaxis protein